MNYINNYINENVFEKLKVITIIYSLGVIINVGIVALSVILTGVELNNQLSINCEEISAKYYASISFGPFLETFIYITIPYHFFYKRKSLFVLPLILSSALFALTHIYYLDNFVYYFIMGAIFFYGYVKLKRTGMQIFCISMSHLLINLSIISVLIIYNRCYM